MKPVLETIKQEGQSYVDRKVFARVKPLAHACSVIYADWDRKSLVSFAPRAQPPMLEIGMERIELRWISAADLRELT